MDDSRTEPRQAATEAPKAPRAPTLPELLEPAYLDLDALVDDLEQQVVCGRTSFFGSTALRAEKIAPGKRKLALAISGGGAAGAYSAGVLEALLGRLRERGIRVDLLVGTSAGALNSYGVFLEELEMTNPQLDSDPELKQPYSTFIASIWSYLDRHRRTSQWIVGRRAWMIDLATRGVHGPFKRWALAFAAVAAVFVLNPFLLVSVLLFAGIDRYLPGLIESMGFTSDHAMHFLILGLLSFVLLAGAVMYVVRMFGPSLFRDVPLLRLLANTGPQGDLRQPWFWPREETVDRARVLSREIVQRWYSGGGEAPELIFTSTNITRGSECLFSLVRPETYAGLRQRGWMAVQLDSPGDSSKPYRKIPGALFTLAENFLQSILSSTAVPSAFPVQEMGLYGASGREVRHHFVDGGVLNNSPIHIAIDAGATHIISVELDPMRASEPLAEDGRGKRYNVLSAGVDTFSILLHLSTKEDVDRTVAWNCFLMRHPEALAAEQIRAGQAARCGDGGGERRLVPLYRIAPRERLIGPADFDGHYEDGERSLTLRGWLRRGLLDMQGPHIWRSTLQSLPDGDGAPSEKPEATPMP